jgi:hypothetical protein
VTSPRAPLLLLLFVAACSDPYARTDAALRAGNLDEALRASEGTAWHDFVRGNVAFARSGKAEKLDVQIALAEDAVAAWRTAAMSRDWPEARRNVERGLLRLEGLYERQRGKTKPPDRKPPPLPPPPGKEEGPETQAKLEKGQLKEADVLRLLDLLRAKEAKKMADRRARLGTPKKGVEKDW